MPAFRFIVVALISLCVLAPGAAAQTQQQEQQRGITVAGVAQSFADNDIATFRLGVTARRPTAAAALRAVAAVQRRVIGAVRSRGVAGDDVRTDVVSLSRGRRVRGRRTHVASNAVIVTVRRIARAGEIVDAAVGAGATSVSGPSFGVSDIKAIYRETLARAFTDARAKAERIAREAGIALGPPIRIVEQGAGDDDESGDFSDAAGGTSERAATPVQPGRSRIDARVTVTFATG
jgi:uncharacterized protein YggE